ncbi:MAG TPA: hypothetical protein VJ577_17580 [Burkholderiaceae bacterium]|nr:hypothetical protein [Burkholderiaceae bacterium]
MQDCVLRLQGNFPDWESDHAKRTWQDAKAAIEKKKDQLPLDDARRIEQQFIQKIAQDFALSRERLRNTQRWLEDPEWTQDNIGLQSFQEQSATSLDSWDKPLHGEASPVEKWTEKVRRIPDIRSGLIPLDKANEDSQWSKAFSLSKADMEPWLSFYKGYQESRLFSGREHGNGHGNLSGKLESSLDGEIRAILELKRISVKNILEPAVRINSQVEYLDLAAEIRGCSDPALASNLARIAGEVHETELAKAIDKGREMGNHLYQALTGSAHANLIMAWEKVYQRKPTQEEMHVMLTTGQVMSFADKECQGTVRKETPCQSRSDQQSKKTAANHDGLSDVWQESHRMQAGMTNEAGKEAPKEPAGSRKWKIILHLGGILACCAVFAIYRLAA